MPPCITGADDPTQCKLLGYYGDGFPIYGFCSDYSGATLKSCWKLQTGKVSTSNQMA